MMMQASIEIILGLTFLVLSADKFVAGSAAAARHLGVSPILVGLTVVAVGTSAPEMCVSLIAAIRGNSAVAVGNAIGSNIANIGLVLGITAIVAPVSVESSLFRREFPIVFMVTILVGVLIHDGYLGRIDGGILAFCMVAYISWLIVIGVKQNRAHREATIEKPKMSMRMAVLWTLLGLVLLLISSHVLVDGAVIVAKHFGMSDLLVGLTIIAVGTSLPEVATAMAGALKGEADLAIGSVLGSNIFNMLAVLIFPGLVHPTRLAPHVFFRDYGMMLAVSVALLLMAYAWRGKGRISRIDGVLLLMSYSGYMTILFLQKEVAF